MDSLNIVQSVSSPTHNGGHTLDLVLTRGFSVHICEIFDTGISDHYPVVFEPVISYDQTILSRPVHYSRVFHANTALELCESYSKFLSNSNAPPSSWMDTERLVEILISVCCIALNTVTPLKRKTCKAVLVLHPGLMHPLALSDKSAGGLSAVGKRLGSRSPTKSWKTASLFIKILSRRQNPYISQTWSQKMQISPKFSLKP